MTKFSAMAFRFFKKALYGEEKAGELNLDDANVEGFWKKPLNIIQLNYK